MESTFIYALCDPDTGEVRYVGKADNPHSRYHEHIRDGRMTYSKSRKVAWIHSLLDVGKTPVLRLIEEVPSKRWKDAEARWIDYYRSQGRDLVNGNCGFGGVVDALTDEQKRERKERMGERKKRISDEWAQDVVPALFSRLTNT